MPKNILLLFTDQQRFDTIAALGNPIIKTPALDSLVVRGISFLRAYTPCPVCIPARFSMHTGYMPHNTDCLYNTTMPDGYSSFMELLSGHGYQTHGVGKMHFEFEGKGPETLWGFDTRQVSEECIDDDDFIQYLKEQGFEHVFDPHGVRSEMYYTPQPSQLPARHHNSSWVVDKSLEFLAQRDKDRPFMLMTSFIKPHPPFETPTPWNKLYRGPEMPLPKLPEHCESFHTYWNSFQNRYKYQDQGMPDPAMQTMKAAYYAAISFIDYNIGRLLAYLEGEQLLKDTLILFSSDHGEMLGDYRCVGKRGFLDPAARIPLLMVHPDLPQNIQCTEPVSLIDILPTLLDYSEHPHTDTFDGKSLIDIAMGRVNREFVFGQYHRGEHAVYMATGKDAKYIYSAPDQKEWYFDLALDPGETINRAYNPVYQKKVAYIKQALMAYLKKDDYLVPFDGDDFIVYEKKSIPDDPSAMLLFQDTAKSLPNIPGYERETVFTMHELLKSGF